MCINPVVTAWKIKRMLFYFDDNDQFHKKDVHCIYVFALEKLARSQVGINQTGSSVISNTIWRGLKKST